nr:PREDICTED: sodium channel protein Nach-like [Bemisia tabaci]
MAAAWDSFQNNAISFVVETNSLNWDTNFPAVSVCETENPSGVSSYASRVYGSQYDFTLDEVLKEIAYFSGVTYYTKQYCSKNDSNCPQNNFKDITVAIRSSCEDIFFECRWNNKPFNCCREFIPVETELGTCFIINSDHGLSARKDTKGALRLISNREKGAGRLLIALKQKAQVYTHTRADVPFYNADASNVFILQNPQTHMDFSIILKETVNDDEVASVSIKQRKCRFAEENRLTVSDRYSFSACIINCRRNKQLELCNCTSHLIPKSKSSEQCDLDGLLCLNNNYLQLSLKKSQGSLQGGNDCYCEPNCDDIELQRIDGEITTIAEPLYSMELKLAYLPSERFRRNVVRRQIDLVVSMGGAVSLFVGASLLSTVEIIYYFTIRQLGSCWLQYTRNAGTTKIHFNE